MCGMNSLSPPSIHFFLSNRSNCRTESCPPSINGEAEGGQYPPKVQGKRGQSTPGGGNKATLKEGTFSVRRDIQGVLLWQIILRGTVQY